MATRIKVKGIASFPAVFEPKAVNPGDTPRYGLNLLLDPEDSQVEKVKEAILKAAEEKWPGKGKKILAALQKQDKVCLHDGDTKDYAGYEGRVFISAASKIRPTVVDRARRPITGADGLIYAGAVVNVLLDIWAQDNQYGKRINAALAGVQFVEHGEPLAGGRPASEDEFDELEAPEDAQKAEEDEEDDTPW